MHRLSRAHLLLALYLGLNLGLILYQPWSGAFDRDWSLWGQLLGDSTPYDPIESGLRYIWSPLMIPVMGIAAGAPLLWGLAHIASVLLVRDVILAGLVFCSWAFWTDVAAGNTMTFSVVSGILAWRGNRSAALIYITLLVLMPRPVQVPLAVLLLVQMPEIRLGAMLLLAAHTAVILPDSAAWITAMLEYSQTTPFDLGPRSIIGNAWIPVGLLVTVWMAWRNRPGWAGLFASPYWLPQYFLMPLVDWRSERLGSKQVCSKAVVGGRRPPDTR